MVPVLISVSRCLDFARLSIRAKMQNDDSISECSVHISEEESDSEAKHTLSNQCSFDCDQQCDPLFQELQPVCHAVLVHILSPQVRA